MKFGESFRFGDRPGPALAPAGASKLEPETARDAKAPLTRGDLAGHAGAGSSTRTGTVAVVVLNWNGLADTLNCLRSLRALRYPSFQVVVVDNGSTDGSVAALRQYDPALPIVETGRNLGYAGGNNAGIRWALARGFDYILLLNNDTEVEPALLDALVDCSRRHADKVAVGARILLADSPERVWDVEARWTPEAACFEHPAHGQPAATLEPGDRPSDYVCGCALMAHRRVFEQVGPLDEAYFLTFEEVDWCFRARALGFESIVADGTWLWHAVSASFGGAQSPLALYFYNRNRLLWTRRHRSRAEFRAARRQTLGRVLTRPPRLPCFDGFLRKPHWTLATWLRDWRRWFNEGERHALILALRDFHLRRFGDAPASLRTRRSA